jgi:hypothetical protein
MQVPELITIMRLLGAYKQYNFRISRKENILAKQNNFKAPKMNNDRKIQNHKILNKEEILNSKQIKYRVYPLPHTSKIKFKCMRKS